MELELYNVCVNRACRALEAQSVSCLTTWLPLKGINDSLKRRFYLGYIEKLQEACALAERGHLDRYFTDVWFPVELPFVEAFEDQRDIMVAGYRREIDRLLALGVDGYKCFM